MQDLFSARIAEAKNILADRADYRQRFFPPGCRWHSLEGLVEMIESERILYLKASESAAAVVTEYQVSLLKLGVRTYRRRYQLKAEGENWLIRLVESECLSCYGQGDESCVGCKGKHWK